MTANQRLIEYASDGDAAGADLDALWNQTSNEDLTETAGDADPAAPR